MKDFNVVELLQPYLSQIKVLSLDCFETLLWRKYASPIDVFYELQKSPTFQKLAITTNQRREAESFARRLMYVKSGRSEVNLQEIYQLGFPNITADVLQALIAEELAAEIQACYVHPYGIKLINYAVEKGLKVILISSTYLQEQQLRFLLGRLMPVETLKCISAFFCSCDYRLAKNNGLFAEVIKQLAVNPKHILHLGDSYQADVRAPSEVGIKALQMIQTDEKTLELLRMEEIISHLACPGVRRNRALPSPFRAVVGKSLADNNPVAILGFSIGQIVYTFAKFITYQINKRIKTNPKLKVFFVMRDAYLPSLAYKLLASEALGQNVALSRFSAVAASFRCKEDVAHYLAFTMSRNSPKQLCQQLLLPDALAQKLLEQFERGKDTHLIYQLLLQDEVISIILEQSKAYRERLKKYLKQKVGLQPKDSVLFVDIGYKATAQRLLTPILQEELGVQDVYGCYLVNGDLPQWSQTRCGLIDASWTNAATIDTLRRNFILFEELLSCDGNSVTDFDANGNPIALKNTLGVIQREKVKEVQKAAMDFILAAKNFFQQANTSIDMHLLRDVALIEMFRIMYFLTETELDFLSDFQHEQNKATRIKAPIFAPRDVELTDLRRRGLTFTTRQLDAYRRCADLDTILLMFSQHLFKYEIRPTDLSLRRKYFKIHIYEYNKKPFEVKYEALPTYDGFFSLPLRVNPTNIKWPLKIEVFVGEQCRWLQLESAELINASYFLTADEHRYNKDVTKELIFKNMKEEDYQLYHCAPDATISFNLNKIREACYIRFVFRPLLGK